MSDLIAGDPLTASKPRQNRKFKPKSGRPPAGQFALRAETLREAAFEVFLEFGYEKAKLGEIVKRAGSSKGTLYAQYSNKEELFKAVMLKKIEAPFVQLDLLVTADLLPLETSLKKLALGLLSFMMIEDNLRFMDVAYQEATRFPDLGRLFYHFTLGYLVTQLSTYFNAHIVAGNLVERDPEVMARQFTEMTLTTSIIKSLLHVERTQTASQRRAVVDVAVGCFMQLYAV